MKAPTFDESGLIDNEVVVYVQGRPDPVATIPDRLTWQEWARVNRDIFRIYGGPVESTSRPEWRQAGWHDRPTIEDENR